MKRLIFISLLLIILNCQIVFAYDTEEIAGEIQCFSPEIKADSGDIEKVLADVFNYDPRLIMYYKGYEGSCNYFSSTIKINYYNEDTPINNIYVANNREEFINLIIRALLYNKSSLYISAKNMPAASTPVNDYISEIAQSCPIAFMGYRGSNISTVDSKITPYSCYVIKFDYDFDSETLLQMKRELQQKACEIVASNIAKNMPPYMKVYIIHNYIVNNCKYATDYDTNNDPSYYTAYGALINGQAVCDGYASAAQILFNLCGIENIKISGTSKGNGHAWNLIKLDNDYYHIDTTWDDPVSYDGFNYLRYDYYNLTDDEISADHTWDRNMYPKAMGTVYDYDNTCELIMNNSTDYNEGYTEFESVFNIYPPLTGSTRKGEETTTETSSAANIEPASILDKADDNINVLSNDIINYIKISIKNNYKLYVKIISIIIILIILKNIFIRK